MFSCRVSLTKGRWRRGGGGVINTSFVATLNCPNLTEMMLNPTKTQLKLQSFKSFQSFPDPRSSTRIYRDTANVSPDPPLVMVLSWPLCTPPKTKLEPESHPFEKENHLPILHVLGGGVNASILTLAQLDTLVIQGPRTEFQNTIQGQNRHIYSTP